MKWREIGPYLRELWHRRAGPMNWKNPIRVFAVLGWLVVQGFVLLGWTVFRVVHFVVRLPALLLFFFGGVWYAVWSFVRRPFPSLDEHQILALVQYHTPDFFSFMVLWYYLSPFVAVMLSGLIAVTVWKVWLEGRRRDFAPFAKLPPWPIRCTSLSRPASALEPARGFGSVPLRSRPKPTTNGGSCQRGACFRRRRPCKA